MRITVPPPGTQAAAGSQRRQPPPPPTTALPQVTAKAFPTNKVGFFGPRSLTEMARSDISLHAGAGDHTPH